MPARGVGAAGRRARARAAACRARVFDEPAHARADAAARTGRIRRRRRLAARVARRAASLRRRLAAAGTGRDAGVELLDDSARAGRGPRRSVGRDRQVPQPPAARRRAAGARVGTARGDRPRLRLDELLQHAGRARLALRRGAGPRLQQLPRRRTGRRGLVDGVSRRRALPRMAVFALRRRTAGGRRSAAAALERGDQRPLARRNGDLMDHVAPQKLMDEIDAASSKKAALGTRAMLIRGFLSGALLAYATAFAYKASGGMAEGVGALVAGAVFPVGFAMIILLGLELATGNFAVLPVGMVRGRLGWGRMMRNWSWVYLGNFLGSIFVGFLLAVALTEAFLQAPGALGTKIIAVAESKTLFYEHAGAHGWLTAFIKGVLCNWMVALGTVLGMSSTSNPAKIAAIWLPVSTFF